MRKILSLLFIIIFSNSIFAFNSITLFLEFKNPVVNYNSFDEDIKKVSDVIVSKLQKGFMQMVETEKTEEAILETSKIKESSFTRAFKQKSLTKFLVGMSIVLLIFVLFAVISLFISKKE